MSLTQKEQVYAQIHHQETDPVPYTLCWYEEEVAELHFGADLTFWGGLGSQSTIPFGTPVAIRSEVATLRRQMARGGGYILSPAKALMLDTPTENAAALVEAFVQRDAVPTT